MRTELFIVTLLVAIVAAVADSPNISPIIRAMKPHFQKCGKKLNSETKMLLKRNPLADNADIHCFYACLWTEAGLMNGARLDIPKIERMMIESQDPEMGLQYMDILKGCQAESEVGENGCEVINKYTKCLQAKLHK